MRTRRRFTSEFKRKVIEEILSESTTIVSQSWRYDIAYQLILCWKQSYLDGKLDNEPVTDAGYKHKIEQLERKIGQLTMENELLKKVLQSTSNQKRANVRSSEIISPISKTSGGGVR